MVHSRYGPHHRHRLLVYSEHLYGLSTRQMWLATEWLERAKSSSFSIALRVITSMDFGQSELFPREFLKPLIPYYEHLELALPYSTIAEL